MGTGGRQTQASPGRPAAPILAGLPRRRYSVPETIMRKYRLTRQFSDSNSDTTAVTAHTLSSPSHGGSSSSPSKPPAEDRRRKPGRGGPGEGGRAGRHTRIRPPMYRGGRAVPESTSSDTTESEEKGQEDKGSGSESSEGGKSPDCPECKEFLLEAIAEESEKLLGKSEERQRGDGISRERSPVAETNVTRPTDTAIVSETVPNDSNKNSIDGKSSVKIESPNGLHLDKIADDYNKRIKDIDTEIARTLIETISRPILSAEEKHVVDNKRIKDIDTEIARTLMETISRPILSAKEKHITTSPDEEMSNTVMNSQASLERKSTKSSLSDTHSPDLIAEENISPVTDPTSSTLGNTSRFSDLTTVGTDSTPDLNPEDEAPEKERRQSSNAGTESCSITPTSSPTSSGGSRPMVESSLANGGASSMTLDQPITDRTESTQDSTMSLVSDLLPTSRAFSLLSEDSARDNEDEVVQPSVSRGDKQEESTGINRDSLEEVVKDVTVEPSDVEAVNVRSPRSKLRETSPTGSTKSTVDVGNESPAEKSESQTDPVPTVDDQSSEQDKEIAAILLETVGKSDVPLVSPEIAELQMSDSDNKIEDKQNPQFCVTNDSNALKREDLNSKQVEDVEVFKPEKYPINRPFSMSKSTEEKYAKITKPTATPNPELPSSAITFTPESQLTSEQDTADVYSWTNRFDEDEYIKLTHQRQRYWMTRAPPTDIHLPATPLHGPLSSVGTGTIYRKNNYDVQLVVPRYSALPRSISMLVNTSSMDCSSNSSDSECLSLVDSLDDVAAVSPKHGYDFKTEDIDRLLPENEQMITWSPKAKAKAFFIPIDAPVPVKSVSPVGDMMPDKLKERLNGRRDEINMKRQQKMETKVLKEQEEKARSEKMRKDSKGKLGKVKKAGNGDWKQSQGKLDVEPVINKENFAKPERKKAVPENGKRETKRGDKELKEINENILDKSVLPLQLLKQSNKPSSIPVVRTADLQKPVSLSRNTSAQSMPPQKPSQLPIRRRHQSPPARKSAILLANRFQQRFEAIPEERSVSLETWNDDKNQGKSAVNDHTPKRDDVPTRTKRDDKTDMKSNAKRPARPTRTIRAVRSDQGPHIENIVIREIDETPSYKGKEAVAPQTDEGISSLSKGYLNFYMLGRQSSPEGNSDDALLTPSDRERKRTSGATLKTVNVIGGDGNRIRAYTVPYHAPDSAPTLPPLLDPSGGRTSRRQSHASDGGGTQDDSPRNNGKITAVLHLPTQRAMFEAGSEEQDSYESTPVESSDSESERSYSPALLPVRWPIRHQQKRTPTNHSRSKTQYHRAEFGQYTRQTSANVGVGWTVTVAGSNSQQQPDVEMRLTFPASARRPHNSQSDSGLGEDNNNNNNNSTAAKGRGEERERKQPFLPPATPTQGTPRTWTLTVKNGRDRPQDSQKVERRYLQCLPDLNTNQGQTKHSKKAIKRASQAGTVGDGYERHTRHLSAIWPDKMEGNILESKVIIRNTTARYSREVRSVSQLYDSDDETGVPRTGVSVTGSAIMLEKKPRVPTMSERDLTRGNRR